jgi:conjugative transfer signal peptidase TraF
MIGRAALHATVVAVLLGQLATTSFLTPSHHCRNSPLSTPLPKVLLWNASASAPRGFYLLRTARPLRIGELVSVSPPDALVKLAAERSYLPPGVPLLKHIAALVGQTVCRCRRNVTIDGRAVAVARERDTRGRLLPSWHGCRHLRAGQVFLLNPSIPDSFDGRYFGALPATAITARAEPLWTFTEH